MICMLDSAWPVEWAVKLRCLTKESSSSLNCRWKKQGVLKKIHFHLEDCGCRWCCWRCSIQSIQSNQVCRFHRKMFEPGWMDSNWPIDWEMWWHFAWKRQLRMDLPVDESRHRMILAYCACKELEIDWSCRETHPVVEEDPNQEACYRDKLRGWSHPNIHPQYPHVRSKEKALQAEKMIDFKIKFC